MLLEPTFVETFNYEKLINDFSDFLYSIFDQDLTNAYRRGKSPMCRLYELKLERSKKIDDLISLVTLRKLRAQIY
jgi:hypothetical protein